MHEFSRNLAVVIGINNYKSGIHPLQTAVNDTKKLVEILRLQHGYQVWAFLDETATLRNLNNLLEKTLPEQVRSDDRLLFYFAGHGIALHSDDGPQGYLIPQDAKLGDIKSYLPMTQLQESLNKLPCRHFLGILDCCFAGAFRWSSTRDLLTVPEVIHKERYERFIQDPAWQVITSAAYDQKALDAFSLDTRGQIGEHSPFAAALLEALAGGADIYPPATNSTSGDGVITATKLYLYLRDSIETVTVEQSQRQTPGLWPLKKHDKGEYIFLTPGHELNLPPAPPLDESKNPYRGLESFEEEHSALFFGRKELTSKLHEFISNHRLTVVLGASGSGKSSLVKAGLIPLVKHLEEESSQWRLLALIRPGESPFSALSSGLVQNGLPAIDIPGEAPEQILNTLTGSVATWSNLSPKSKLLLVIDQCEELITLCGDEQRRRFLSSLAEAIAAHPEQLRIVLTLRSDFEPQFRDTALEPDWTAARFVVPSMTREELRSCIEEPASARVMYFEPYSLVDQLIDEVAQMPGALPLLSFTLSELYLNYLKSEREGKQRNRAITQADYEELGGVTRSLTQRADYEYDELVRHDPGYAKTIQDVMLRMVAVGGGELARRRVLLSELEYPEPENERARKIVQRFSAARLLVGGIDGAGKSYVEPAHDALVRGWQKLLAWKKQEQESLMLQRRLTPAAEEWKSKQQTQYLWNADPRLDLLKQVLESEHNWFNRVEIEFVERSVTQKRKNVVMRWSIVATALTVLTGVTITALYQRQISNLRAIAADVQRIAPAKPVQALVRAVDASGQILAGSVVDVQSSLLSAIEIPKERTILKVPGETLVTSVAVLSDGGIVSGSSDGTLVLWDKQGNQVATTSAGTAINSIAACSKAPLVVIGGGDGSIRLWNLQDKVTPGIFALQQQNNAKAGSIRQNNNPYATGQVIGQDNSAIKAVALSTDCQSIAASNAQEMWLWNQQKNLIRKPFRYPQGITAVAVSPDGQTVAGGSQDGTIFLSNANGITSFTQPGGVNALAFSPNGQFIVSGGKDDKVYLWSREGKQVKPFQGHEDSVTSVAFSPNGQFIVSGSHDNSVRLWDLKGNQLGEPLQGHESWVNSVAISLDSHSIVSGSNDGTVRLWDVKDDLISPSSFQGYESKVWSVAISADGQLIANADGDGAVRLWDRHGNRIGEPSVRHNGPVWAIAITNDGKTIVSGGDDGTIRLWDSLGNPIVEPFRGNDNSISSVAITSDGKFIVSGGSNGTLQLWNRQGNPISEPVKVKGSRIGAVAFSPDEYFIASGSNDGIVRLWNKQGKLIREFPKIHTLAIESVAFSPDGKLIASGSQDNTLQLWSRDTGKPLSRFRGHTGWVSAIAFSPDNHFIATGSWDKTVRLWDINGNAMGRPFRGHSAWISNVRFSFDGQSIISGSADKTLRLWQGGNRRTWLQVACSQLSNPSFQDLKDAIAIKARNTCTRSVR